jgi:hypothetical protein
MDVSGHLNAHIQRVPWMWTLYPGVKRPVHVADLSPPSRAEFKNARCYGPPKRWYPTTTLHDVTTQKTSIRIFTSNFALNCISFTWYEINWLIDWFLAYYTMLFHCRCLCSIDWDLKMIVMGSEKRSNWKSKLSAQIHAFIWMSDTGADAAHSLLIWEFMCSKKSEGLAEWFIPGNTSCFVKFECSVDDVKVKGI